MACAAVAQGAAPRSALTGKSTSVDRSAHVQNAANALRVKANFTSRFNVIWVVQVARQKYTASTVGQISHISPRVSPN
jgi:hypothetical protein